MVERLQESWPHGKEVAGILAPWLRTAKIGHFFLHGLKLETISEII